MQTSSSLSASQTSCREVGLAARAPFAFEHSLSFLCSFPPTNGEQLIERRALTKAVSIEGRAALVTVRETNAGLRCAVITRAALSPLSLERVVSRARFQLSLDDDLTPFHALAADDPAFAPLERRWHGHHHVKFPSPFEIAVWTVLAQRNGRPPAQASRDRESVRSRSQRGQETHH